jgi:hypothetical protein
MKRLFGLMVICFGVLSLLISVIIIGHKSGEIAVLPELHYCNGTVCLFTIVPNRTTVADAQAALEKTNLFVFSDSSNRMAHKQSLPSYKVILQASKAEISSVSELITDIALQFLADQSDLMAGVIIAKFGQPCAIVSDWAGSSGRTGLLYPGMEIIFRLDGSSSMDRFGISSAVEHINIFANAMPCEELSQKLTLTRWKGFTFYQMNR